MHINKADFILSHKNTSFNELYTAESDNILGQGKLIHFYIIRGFWKGDEMCVEINWCNQSS